MIGGSGFYSFFDSSSPVTEVAVETPFGPPSAPLTLGSVAGRRVAFVPRHGAAHEFAPHRVNYRANLWALRTVGVRQVLGPCAVGSLRPELGPGTLVVPDQVVPHRGGPTPRTTSRAVVHVAFADPYCPRGRTVAAAQAHSAGWPVAESGTLVVVNGPRFSSRAESQWHAARSSA